MPRIASRPYQARLGFVLVGHQREILGYLSEGTSGLPHNMEVEHGWQGRLAKTNPERNSQATA
jgi:hypothetical protein